VVNDCHGNETEMNGAGTLNSSLPPPYWRVTTLYNKMKLVTMTHQHGTIQTNKRAVEAKGLQHNVPAIYIQRCR